MLLLPPQPRRARGLTLIELAVVLALAALLVTLALPTFTGPVTQVRRGDAIAALTRLHLAQEQHRAHHGLYAADLGALHGVAARSDGGHYELTLVRSAPLAYAAVAQPRAGSVQAGDAECAQITLHVDDGLAEFGPGPRCWNR